MTLSQQYPDQMLSVKAIQLTRGKVAIIDPEDSALVGQYKWHAQKGRTTYYAVANIPHPDGGWYYYPDGSRSKRQASLLMHTLLTGYPETDHANGNGLDNRHANLRDATHAQNMANSRTRRNNMSGHTGVSWHIRAGKWQAQIGLYNQHIHLGYYVVFNDAVAAYHEAAGQYFGEFAPRCCETRQRIA